MALFKINYDKPGKGVDKDEPEKSLPMQFFTTFFRRLSKFMQVNLIFMIPMAAVAALMFFVFVMPAPRYEMEMTLSTSVLRLQLWEMYAVPLPLVLLSPFYGGMLVVVRRMVRKEYVFPWSEYWTGVKENFKPFLLNGFFCYLAYVVLSFSIIYYSNQLNDNWFTFIPLALVLIFTVLFLFAQLYVPILTVSVELNTFARYKNSFIFAIMGVFKNLLVAILFAVIGFIYLFVLPIMPLTIIIGFVLFVLVIPVFCCYINAFICYPMVETYIINPYEKKEETKNAPEVQPSTENFIYQADELDDEREDSEYVYYNGRLIKKDEIKED